MTHFHSGYLTMLKKGLKWEQRPFADIELEEKVGDHHISKKHAKFKFDQICYCGNKMSLKAIKHVNYKM